jgi:hypothetical protein
VDDEEEIVDDVDVDVDVDVEDDDVVVVSLVRDKFDDVDEDLV